MPHRVLGILAVAAALAGCGTMNGVTTTRAPSGKRPPTIKPTCPRSDRAKPVSNVAGARSSLVPGHPEAVLLCRYSGLNGRPRLALVRARTVTDPDTIRRLAHELDALPTAGSGVINCPADFADSVIAYFVYATPEPDPVTVDLSGCQAVGNGHGQRLAGMARSPIASQLEVLTRSSNGA